MKRGRESSELEQMGAALREVVAAVAALREDLAASRAELADARRLLLEAALAATDDEPNTRRLLRRTRALAGYEDAWTDPEPLVTVVLPTYRNWQQLEARSLPSALAQTYSRLEVVVVGDAAPPETAEAIERLGDPRVRYENLLTRGPYPDEDDRLWLVAGTGPMNRAMELARGSWIAFLNDDDALAPEHVEVLLEEARRSRAEVAYSKLWRHAPDGTKSVLGAFPPQTHAFGWQLALQHRELRMFEYELAAATFGQPGDWHRARRMLRAGVRFSQTDRVTVDYFPRLLWNVP
jgi:hypothetical protein